MMIIFIVTNKHLINAWGVRWILRREVGREELLREGGRGVVERDRGLKK